MQLFDGVWKIIVYVFFFTFLVCSTNPCKRTQLFCYIDIMFEKKMHGRLTFNFTGKNFLKFCTRELYEYALTIQI